MSKNMKNVGIIAQAVPDEIRFAIDLPIISVHLENLNGMERVNLYDLYQKELDSKVERQAWELALLTRNLLCNYVPLNPMFCRCREAAHEIGMYRCMEARNYSVFYAALTSREVMDWPGIVHPGKDKPVVKFVDLDCSPAPDPCCKHVMELHGKRFDELQIIQSTGLTKAEVLDILRQNLGKPVN